MRERLHERWRDKTRDNLTSTLNSLGVRAGIADRGRDEENVGKGMLTRSLGVVEVPEGPIRWINVVKQDGGRHNPPRWWMVFCVPDDERDTTPDDLREVDGRQTIDIKTSREKSFPLFGRVTGITWDGDDRGHTIARCLRRGCGNHEPREEDPQPGGLQLRQGVPRMDATGGGPLPPVAAGLGSAALGSRGACFHPRLVQKARHRTVRRSALERHERTRVQYFQVRTARTQEVQRCSRSKRTTCSRESAPGRRRVNCSAATGTPSRSPQT